ncbi:MAG: filamentous hemagglutinin N-terminal domain-containing protein, partial [Alphaproteobacteria bacterium]|nr:filamentous hemagglutinin N-terminal domain-containing protein [Alphaproteobacteria bacterium]
MSQSTHSSQNLHRRTLSCNRNLCQYLACTVALTALLGLTAQNAAAIPTGFTVATGGGTAISTASGNTININQTSNRAVIEWTNFNVAPNETVTFTIRNGAGGALDPSGATLNRITGGASSSIRGTVTSNGTLYFVNPN